MPTVSCKQAAIVHRCVPYNLPLPRRKTGLRLPSSESSFVSHLSPPLPCTPLDCRSPQQCRHEKLAPRTSQRASLAARAHARSLRNKRLELVLPPPTAKPARAARAPDDRRTDGLELVPLFLGVAVVDRACGGDEDGSFEAGRDGREGGVRDTAALVGGHGGLGVWGSRRGRGGMTTARRWEIPVGISSLADCQRGSHHRPTWMVGTCRARRAVHAPS